MFKKAKLKKEIKDLQKEIEMIEKKRYRSQAKLVEAILTQDSPSDEDVDYFNRYTAEIEGMREKIRDLQRQLDALEA